MSRLRGIVLAYHYPPSQAAGAHRWDAFSRYAATAGISLDVITATKQTSLQLERDDGTRVHYVAHREFAPKRFLKSLSRLRSARSVNVVAGANTTKSVEDPVRRFDELDDGASFKRRLSRSFSAWMLHEEYQPWITDTASIANKIADRSQVDFVVSSGPPQMSHLAALRIAEALSIPLILDFRDPWSLIDTVQEFVASRTWYHIAKKYETQVVDAAKLVVMNTPAAAAAMRGEYPLARICTVPNGYSGFVPAAKHDSATFRIVYAGAIYLDRDPRPILGALALLRREVAESQIRIEMIFAGDCESYGGVPLTHLADKVGVGDLVTVRPQMPRGELAELLSSAAVLVNLPQGARLCVPSKIYEYLHFPSWIVGLEPEGSATSDVLTANGIKPVVPSDSKELSATLLDLFRRYERGERPTPTVKGSEYQMDSRAALFYEEVRRALGMEA